ncbi:MAG: ribose 5-phosphate isomerase B [Richelia sp. RM2_1_2]|nr:ribose 5-phosphate isomerase B [Richelia sp. RM2_1_2]
MKTIYIASDHAGFEAKQQIIAYLLDKKQYIIEDAGCFESESCDYPDFAHVVANFVSENPINHIGILICGTGIGMAIAANRFKNVRATLVHSVYLAEMARLHGDCNVITLGSRTHTLTELKVFVNVFLNTEFEGGRHARRVENYNI